MKFPVMLQIYTVRDFAEKDFAATLGKLRGIGYEYVELAGMYGHSPAELKSMLDDAGIKAVSAHVPVGDMQGHIGNTLDAYKAVGCEYIAVPYLPDDMRPGTPGFPATLDFIREVGEACRERGLTLLYHNHDFEFLKLEDGSFGLDYIYSHIPAELLQTELDVCWVRVAGQDPAGYVRKYAGRAPIVHLKDYVGEKSEGMYDLIGQKKTAKESGKFEFRPVGDGVQDFPSILAAAAEAGSRYICVEQDQSYGITSLESAKRSFDYLTGINK